MPFMHSMALLATGAAIGAYGIYRIKSFVDETAEEMEAMQFGDEESFFQKLMRYQRYVQIAQSAYDAAILYGIPLYDYLRGGNSI